MRDRVALYIHIYWFSSEWVTFLQLKEDYLKKNIQDTLHAGSSTVPKAQNLIQVVPIYKTKSWERISLQSQKN